MYATTMEEAALAGYGGEANTHLYRSPLWYAHQLGVYLKATFRSEPRDVRMSRGYSVRCKDMVFKHVEGATFERVK